MFITRLEQRIDVHSQRIVDCQNALLVGAGGLVGEQNVPQLFDQCVPLCALRQPVFLQLAHGEVLKPLDESQEHVDRVVQGITALGVDVDRRQAVQSRPLQPRELGGIKGSGPLAKEPQFRDGNVERRHLVGEPT